MLGPIDYIVVGFEGNNFDGSVMEELGKAVDSGIIRVVDLLFIIKDAEGNVEAAEIEDQHEELQAAAKKVGYSGDLPLLSEEDIDKVAADMENDTAAGILIVEQLWAKGLKKALLDANGTLLAEGRIHPDVVVAAVKELETSHKA